MNTPTLMTLREALGIRMPQVGLRASQGSQPSRSYEPVSPRDPGVTFREPPPVHPFSTMTPPGLSYPGGAGPTTLSQMTQPPDPRFNFSGPSPWATATGRQFTDDTATESYPVTLGSPENPNINYPMQATAQGVGQRFGLPVREVQGAGLNPIDAPQYFVGEQDTPAGQVKFWEQRGDAPWEIALRLGLDPTQYGAPAGWERFGKV